MTPEGRQELEAVIAEMREAVLNADRPYPIAIFHESVSSWARRLALLLAEAPQVDQSVRKVTDEELAPFIKAMEEEVIPAIVEAVHQRAISAANARGKVIVKGPPQTAEELRIALTTEQTMRAAWEKRAYQAERELAEAKPAALLETRGVPQEDEEKKDARMDRQRRER